jgi:hypothetical protein
LSTNIYECRDARAGVSQQSASAEEYCYKTRDEESG